MESSSLEKIKARINELKTLIQEKNENIGAIEEAKSHINPITQVLEKRQLEKLLKQEEQDRDEMTTELQEKKKQLVRYDLGRALEGLNFQKQKRYLNGYLQNNRVGAFFIHGNAGYGQRWLHKLLCRSEVLSGQKKMIPLDFSIPSFSQDFRGVMDWLCREVERSDDFPDYNLDEKQAVIIQKVCQILANQHVVITFYSPKVFLRSSEFENFAQQFWSKLYAEAKSVDSQYKLLLFLSEEEKITLEAKPHFVPCERFEPKAYPRPCFIDLSPIQALSAQLLSTWVDFNIGNLVGNHLMNQDFEAWVAHCAGSPALLIDKICQEFQFQSIRELL